MYFLYLLAAILPAVVLVLYAYKQDAVDFRRQFQHTITVTLMTTSLFVL